MKYIIVVLFIITIAGCKENLTDSGTGSENIIYRKDGVVDSLSFIRHVGIGQDVAISLDLSGYTKIRITFDYKTNADTAEYSIYRYGLSYNLWRTNRYGMNTNGEYLNYDTSVSIGANTSGAFTKTMYMQGDSCYFVSRNLKIYGVN